MRTRLLRPLSFWRIALLAGAFSLAACEPIATPEPFEPMLVTLPSSGQIALPTVTPQVDTPTPEVPPTETPIPVATPQIASGSIRETRLIWEWNQTGKPAALGASGDRLGVLADDGRFFWLDRNSGRPFATALVWSGILQGATWGQVYAEGTLALVNAYEQSANPVTGAAESRSRVLVYDGDANLIWSLPELKGPHYSAIIALATAVVGIGPGRDQENFLAAYDLASGQEIWRIEEDGSGFQSLAQDGTRLFAIISGENGSEVAAYDLRTGEALWRWSSEALVRPDGLFVGGENLYVVSADRTYNLAPFDGSLKWNTRFNSAPSAGVVIKGGLFAMAPAPSAELGFRPGVVGRSANTGEIAWHTLNGQLIDPISGSEDYLWGLIKDYDEGAVYLSAMAYDSGLEQVRVRVGNDPTILYGIAVENTRVYVLGETLLAYGY